MAGRFQVIATVAKVIIVMIIILTGFYYLIIKGSFFIIEMNPIRLDTESVEPVLRELLVGWSSGTGLLWRTMVLCRLGRSQLRDSRNPQSEKNYAALSHEWNHNRYYHLRPDQLFLLRRLDDG